MRAVPSVRGTERRPALLLLATGVLLIGMISAPFLPEAKVAASATQAPSVAQHLVIPAYFPPGVTVPGYVPDPHDAADWGRIDNSGAGNIVVFGIEMGVHPPTPGTPLSEADVQQVRELQARQIKVFGYVFTDQGNRPITDTQTDIQNWYQTYNPDGIFLDEGPLTTHIPQAVYTYYMSLRDYVHTTIPQRFPQAAGTKVLLNAAGTPDEQVMDLADIVNIVEYHCDQYQPETFDEMYPWIPKYGPDRFSQVITACADDTAMQRAISCSKDRGAGYVYVFDTKHDKPPVGTGYNHLPPDTSTDRYWDPAKANYWSQEVAAVQTRLVSTERPPVESLTDWFTGSGTAVQETLWQMPLQKGGGTVTETNGALVLDLPATILPNQNAVAEVWSGNTYDLTSGLAGSRAYVHAVQVPGTSANTNFELVRRIQGTDPPALRWRYEAGMLYALYTDPAGVETTVASLTYSSTDHAWWQIREDNGTVFWETSPTGADGSWMVRGSKSDTQLFPLDALTVHLVASKFHTTGSTSYAQYSNLNMNGPPCSQPTPTNVCFDPMFMTFWQQHGGLAINGWPVSDAFWEKLEDGHYYRVQYFQRSRIEHHPENGPPFDFMLGLFGPRIHAPYPPVPPIAGAQYFSQTGHNLQGDFLTYWSTYGGVTQFGYPISEEVPEVIDGHSYIVQYFQRARMEHHPENAPGQQVLLGLFGWQIYQTVCPLP